MGLLRRRRDVSEDREDRDVGLGDTDTRDEIVEERREAAGPEVTEFRDNWSPANVLAALAGAALAALGIVALIRTEINDTWYTPVEDVLSINHTPLLAAIEVGVGALLVILGLLGLRRLAAFVALAVAVGAAVAAIDPGMFETELAIERWWAITLAAAGGALAVLLMLPTSRTVVATDRGAPTVRRRRGYGRVVQQH
jgi:hypothetical protein